MASVTAVDSAVEQLAPAGLALDQAIDEANQVGLRYVSDAEPGIRRRRRGKGFGYVDAHGERVDGTRRQSIEQLAIPPAWTDVWICADPRGHLQATGRDNRGRKQYRYHPDWRRIRDRSKFDRIADFGERLPDLRAQIEDHLGLPGLPRERVLALVTALLDETLIRVGNEEYAVDNRTYGLTTLTCKHVSLGSGRVVFDFVGKGGADQSIAVADRRLARLVRRCHELGGKKLFTYVDADDAEIEITSADVNDYLREQTGLPVSAKDFRTWGATALVAKELAEREPDDDARRRDAAILGAIDAAAEMLGNTRTVCRSSYVHPRVPAAYEDGTLAEQWRRVRRSARLERSERAVLALLA